MRTSIELRWPQSGPTGVDGQPQGVTLSVRSEATPTGEQMRELADVVDRVEAFIAEVWPASRELEPLEGS